MLSCLIESFFCLQQTALKRVFYLLWSRLYMIFFCFNCLTAVGLQHFSRFCLHIVACIFSCTVINVVFMPSFNLEVVHKCNMPVEPATKTSAEHTVGGVQKCSDDELGIVPNKLGVTFPSTRVPCLLPPHWPRDVALRCQPLPDPQHGRLGCLGTRVQ